MLDILITTHGSVSVNKNRLHILTPFININMQIKAAQIKLKADFTAILLNNILAFKI
jgi:hypothetical protein